MPLDAAAATNRQTPDLVAKHNPTLSALNVQLHVQSEKKLTFLGQVTAKCPPDGGYEGPLADRPVAIADPTGKVRTWGDVDSLIRALVKGVPTLTSIVLSVDTTKLQPTENPLATPAQLAQRRLPALTSRRTAQGKRLDDINAHIATIASFATGTPAQQGVYAEAVAKQKTVGNQLSYLTDEIARLQALIPAP
jgi:hypothetical protein